MPQYHRDASSNYIFITIQTRRGRGLKYAKRNPQAVPPDTSLLTFHGVEVEVDSMEPWQKGYALHLRKGVVLVPSSEDDIRGAWLTNAWDEDLEANCRIVRYRNQYSLKSTKWIYPGQELITSYGAGYMKSLRKEVAESAPCHVMRSCTICDICGQFVKKNHRAQLKHRIYHTLHDR
jgi:hypothetical protein